MPPPLFARGASSSACTTVRCSSSSTPTAARIWKNGWRARNSILTGSSESITNRAMERSSRRNSTDAVIRKFCVRHSDLASNLQESGGLPGCPYFHFEGDDISEYAHPEVLVSTEWAASHLNDPKIRLVEVDVDTSAYERGHI